MTSKASILAVILALAGLIVPFWPLSLIGIAVICASGGVVLGLSLAILFDIVWGLPSGILEVLVLPATALALLILIGRILVLRYMRRGMPERL